MSSEEFKLLWQVMTEIQKSTSYMNSELGAVQQNLEWLNWCVKGIIAGIVISIGLSVWNLILHKNKEKL